MILSKLRMASLLKICKNSFEPVRLIGLRSWLLLSSLSGSIFLSILISSIVLLVAIYYEEFKMVFQFYRGIYNEFFMKSGITLFSPLKVKGSGKLESYSVLFFESLCPN